jgi:hypothetical protein
MLDRSPAETVSRGVASVSAGMCSVCKMQRLPATVFVILGLCFLFAYTIGLLLLPKADGRILRGDSVYYYVYLRSALHDYDLRLANDFEGISGPVESPRAGVPPVARPGYIPNPMSIGPALIWAPTHLLVTACVYVGKTVGLDYPLDGFGGLFQAAVGWTGILVATLGAYFSYLLCARRYSPGVALAATITVWFSSSAIYYTVVSPTYSHSCSMLVVSGFVLFWAAGIGEMSLRRFGILGALGGLCALVRFQDAVLLVVPLLEAASYLGKQLSARALGIAIGRAAICVASAAVAFSPQLVVWTVIYGHVFLVPQGSDFMEWSAPYVWPVLFSDWRGLLTVTPIIAVSIWGVVWVWRDWPEIAPGVTAALLVSLYTNSSVLQWWAGESFGARRFVSCFPFFVLGLAAVFARMRPRAIVAFASVFIVLNGLLLLQYQVFMHGLHTVAPYPRGFYGLVLARFVVPFKLLAVAMRTLWA